VIHETNTVTQGVKAGLLWRRLRWRRKKVGDLFDTFRKVELRLFAQAIAVGF
jgi:hypothetical protein